MKKDRCKLITIRMNDGRRRRLKQIDSSAPNSRVRKKAQLLDVNMRELGEYFWGTDPAATSKKLSEELDDRTQTLLLMAIEEIAVSKGTL